MKGFLGNAFVWEALRAESHQRRACTQALPARGLDPVASLRRMVHSRSSQGLSPGLHLAGGFSAIAHLLGPVPGDSHGDPARPDQEKWGTACADELLMSGLWLLAPPQGSSSEGAAWVTLGTQQLCGGCRFLLPPLCFRFGAFLSQSEHKYLTARSPAAAATARGRAPRRAERRATRGAGLGGQKGQPRKPAGHRARSQGQEAMMSDNQESIPVI